MIFFEKSKWILIFRLFISNQCETNNSDSISNHFAGKVHLNAVSKTLLHVKPEKRLRKVLERFCSQMFDSSSSCLQAVHCCSMCVSSPIGNREIQTILVQEQLHRRPVLFHCHKAFPLTPPCWVWCSESRTGGWCWQWCASHEPEKPWHTQGPVKCLMLKPLCLWELGLWSPDVPTRAPASALPLIKRKKGTRPRTYTAWSKSSPSMPFRDCSVVQVLQWQEECCYVFFCHL